MRVALIKKEALRLLLSISVPAEAALFRLIEPKHADATRILVIRMDGIGDFVLWLGAARALRQLYPREQYRITLIANAPWARLAEQQAEFDEVWSVDRSAYFRSPIFRWRLWRRIVSAGFNVVLNPTYSREFYVGDVFAWVSGAMEKVGWDGDSSNMYCWQRRISDRWYTRLVKGSNGPIMEIQRNAEFMRALGLPSFRSGLAEIRVVRARVAALRAIGEYFVVFPGAAWAEKCWPSERWVEIMRRLCALTGWTAVICGGEADKVQASGLVDEPGCINLVGKTTLVELVDVIGGSCLLLTNDTSAVHLAAAQRVPAVCVVGGGHFGRFLPYVVEDANGPLPAAVHHNMDCFGCDWRCIYRLEEGRAYPCIENILVDDVWRATQNALTGKSRASTVA